MSRKGIIYIFIFPNGKKYVGQTIDIKTRYKNHKRRFEEQLVNKAIKKYGWENIEKIEMKCSEQYLNWQEVECIKLYDSLHPYGYNLETGGRKNKRVSEETRRKLSEASRDRSRGPRSEETKVKLSNALKGKIMPLEIRNKISESQKGEKNHNYGKSKSEEVKNKISISRMGISPWNKGKHLSEEYKSKISKTKKENPSRFWLGKHRSEETKYKISETLKLRRGGLPAGGVKWI